MVNPVNISVSALQAQTQKYANAANNIANADVQSRVGDAKGGYTPVDTVFTSTNGAVRAVTEARQPAKVETYAPQSPLANADGLVATPNVNVTEELLVSKQAEQAYKAAASILRFTSDMDDTLLGAVDKSV